MSKKTNSQTQEEIVLLHLKDFGTITSWEAFTDYGITRLSAYIYNLRKKMYNIESENITRINRYNKIVTFAKYKLV